MPSRSQTTRCVGKPDHPVKVGRFSCRSAARPDCPSDVRTHETFLPSRRCSATPPSGPPSGSRRRAASSTPATSQEAPKTRPLKCRRGSPKRAEAEPDSSADNSRDRKNAINSPLKGVRARFLTQASAPAEWGETTDQLRTTTVELSAPQRLTMDTSDHWFRRDNHRHTIWGSRGREFKSRQPDKSMSDYHT
jgi:hypothetical protein